MRELRRVLFNRKTIFMLALLTAIGCVLFVLSANKSQVANDYPAVYNRAYHEIIVEYSGAAYNEQTDAAIEERIRDANLIGSLAAHLRLIGHDADFDELLANDPELGRAFLAGEYQRYIDEPLLAQARATPARP